MTEQESSLPPWPEPDLGQQRAEDPAYPDLLAAQRLLLNRLAAASLPTEVSEQVTAQLNALADTVAAYEVSERDRADSWRKDLASRASAGFPPFRIEEASDGRIAGTVTFTRLFLGGNGAAHGGAIPLLFDDVVGLAANRNKPGIARTAFLKVNYRQVTPIDVELRFEATCDSIDGRKRWATGRLLSLSGELLADAEALFVELRPGMP